MVSLDIHEYAPIAEHKTRSGESGIVGTDFSAEGAQFAVNCHRCLVVKVHRGGWGGNSR